jgi:hypothetical protein
MLDPLRRRVVPEAFVNTASVQAIKRAALVEHQSQHAWLVATQGLNSFIAKADEDGRLVGRASKKFQFAEGWWRHLHYGFSANEVDLLQMAVRKNYLANKAYWRRLASA